MRTTVIGLAILAALGMNLGGKHAAAEPLRPRILGAWRLVAVYDAYADGTRRDTWGADPQGLIVFTPEGLFTATILGGDRKPRAGTVPSDPVGPAVAYYGRFEIDEAQARFTTEVEQSTFPQWTGQSLPRKIVALSETTLKVEGMPITGPDGRAYVPHLEFARVR
jgi:hypothetical protein